MHEEVTLEDLERFSSSAPDIVRERSREMDAFLREEGNKVSDLTKHADHIRKVLEKIQDLKEEFIPALKARKSDFLSHIKAVQAMGFIRAECEAMQCLLR